MIYNLSLNKLCTYLTNGQYNKEYIQIQPYKANVQPYKDSVQPYKANVQNL